MSSACAHRIFQTARKALLLVLFYAVHTVAIQFLNASPVHTQHSHNYYAKQQQDHKKKPFSLFIANHIPLKENNSFKANIPAVVNVPLNQAAMSALRNEKHNQPLVLCRADDAYQRYRLIRSLLI
jgi:hypothetical protein